MTLGEVVSAVPGVVALLGAAVGYGRLSQRVADLENVLSGPQGLKANVDEMKTDVAVLKQRSGDAKDKLSDINGKLDRLVERILDGNGNGHR